MPDKTYGS